jgi:hypothetical protein
VVAGVGEVRAPVSGGAVLQLEVEAREVVAARHRSREEKLWAGEKNSVGGGGSVLKGSSGEGGRRGGRRMEAEWERGGHGAVWSSMAARQRPGHGTCVRRVAGRQWRAVGST